MDRAKEYERLKNQGNAALFNLIQAAMRKVGKNEWAMASRSILYAAQLARKHPSESLAEVILRAIESAVARVHEAPLPKEKVVLATCEEAMLEAGDAGRIVVLPALLLSARTAHESPKLSAHAIALRALQGGLKELEIEYDQDAFAEAIQTL